LNRCRRLAKDWENLNLSGLVFLRLASIRLMVTGAKVLARGLSVVDSLLRQIDSATGKWIPESGNF